MKNLIATSIALVSLGLCIDSRAGHGRIAEQKTAPPAVPPVPDWIVNFDGSYTFKSDLKNGRGSGDSSLKEFEFARRFSAAELDLPNPANGGWYLRLGATYSRWDFNNSGSLRLPNHLQSVAGKIALEYLVKGQTGILFETEPGVYFEDDIRANNFDAPTNLALAYPVTQRLTLVGGISYAGLRSSQFLPIAGFVWTIKDRWKVFALPLEPRIIYTHSEALSLWAGGELAGGSFRVDDRTVPGKPSLNNAVLTYSEWRAGAGLTYRFAGGGGAVELGGGYAFKRKFDYHRAEEGFSTDEGAPFVKLNVNFGF